MVGAIPGGCERFPAIRAAMDHEPTSNHVSAPIGWRHDSEPAKSQEVLRARVVANREGTNWLDVYRERRDFLPDQGRMPPNRPDESDVNFATGRMD